ncbi:pilin N-terminal domain-containing protein [Vagococcus fluvialis]|uniref:pilin N-terminal domain-containing protein n=1 Tax=Vagococcus fluvialis TaxID=2738 RepID=UPI003D115671
MKKLIKVISFLFLFSLSVSLLGTTKVNAEEDILKTEFILHKRMYIDPKANPKEVSNTGLEMPDEEFMNKETTYGLNDVVFEIYDVSEYVRKQREEKKSTQEIQKYFSDTKPNQLAENFKNNLVDTVVTKTINGESGIAVFEATSKEETPAYLILEKAAPLIKGQKIIKLAMPMLIILPVENPLEEGNYLSTIHLYPKNAQYNVPESEKEVPPAPRPDPKPNKPFLPQTGEIKSVMAILGVVVIAVVFWIWKNKRNTQESI